MAFNDYKNKNIIKLLATKSRRTDISPLELCEVHKEMGRYLAYELCDEISLKEIEIKHPQGVKTGYGIENEKDIFIFALMRAGFYAAEGVRKVFEYSPLVLLDNNIDEILKQYEVKNKNIILVDSVINSGKTISKVIQKLLDSKAGKIFVITLVMQSDAVVLTEKYPQVSFYTARTSDNKYTGKGGIDTGNRLFNTTFID